MKATTTKEPEETLPSQFLIQVSVTLIPKPGKDTSENEQYKICSG